MGVQITDILEGRDIEIADLTGRVIVIDALNVLYKCLSIIRQPYGTPLKDSKGRVTSHLSGLFYRTTKLIEEGIKPVFVFDGEPPEFKSATNLERRERREEARKRYEDALQRGDIEEARKYAMQSTTVHEEMISDSKNLLEAMGVPYVQAPSEGEAQAAYICRKGAAWSVASQDYDSLLFGAPRLLRNIAITGKRKMPGRLQYVDVKPELLVLDEILKNLQITREKLIVLGMLVGTDYNPGGVRGIGPKTALKMVRDHSVEELLTGVDWGIQARKVFDFFLNPPITDDFSIHWKEPNEEEIKRILCDEHDFSESRIETGIERLKKKRGSGTQMRLDSFRP
ncbi:MAG: flap endonuclease-1 [Candidatus Aenigmatarchaeota archaeon]|nr:MAG: flap endonuclease-1 [Candidatus Aenigmarchaeota archaeon]